MVYKWYILPIGGLYATYPLLWEPETTIAKNYATTQWAKQGHFLKPTWHGCRRQAPHRHRPTFQLFRPAQVMTDIRFWGESIYRVFKETNLLPANNMAFLQGSPSDSTNLWSRNKRVKPLFSSSCSEAHGTWAWLPSVQKASHSKASSPAVTEKGKQEITWNY